MSQSKHDRTVASVDAWARRAITLGGATVIFSVIGILVFILYETFPLFQPPTISKSGEWALSKRLSSATAAAIGTDEYKETAFRLDDKGDVDILSLETGQKIKSFNNPLMKDTIVSSSRMARRNWIAFGLGDGYIGSAEIKYRSKYQAKKRVLEPSVEYGPLLKLDSAGGPITAVTGYVDDEGNVTIAGFSKKSGLAIVVYRQSDAAEKPANEFNPKVTSLDVFGENVTSMATSSQGPSVLAGSESGMILSFVKDGESWALKGKVGASDAAITALSFLIGGEALIMGDAKGSVSEWFDVRHVRIKNNGSKTASIENGLDIKAGEELELADVGYGEKKRLDKSLALSAAGKKLLKIRSFGSHSKKVETIAVSPRNLGFATFSADGNMAYHYSTSGRTFNVWKPGQRPVLGVFTPKSNGLMALGDGGMLYNYALDEKHPEITTGTLFSKVWYEGYARPEYVWQSSGGTDDFEPKFSLVPLIFGTLKGTFYALIFSIPIAIFGAVYLSQIAPSKIRSVVKPVIELMAAIPSVVVGFLAGLWLSPLLNNHTAAFFMVFLAIPTGWLVFVCIIWALPRMSRPNTSGMWELFLLLPIVVASIAVGYFSSPMVERVFFHGDIKQWMYTALGVVYDPRNSVVVGFALGLAVIPIIFTIAEDALSAVPPSLTTASYALAASRWQTAIHVALPAASPGIFAAVMLGLGRAVGETMIVLMATGNTPIMDWSVFNGMRAMSAAIAVEMPEAPVGGSLYRVLFLVGLLLFAFTFVINTLAEIITMRLRKRFSRL
jgi:phosphate transport system permease protein